jgi:RNA polymerase sigma-70 factor (ECF subfamily)
MQLHTDWERPSNGSCVGAPNITACRPYLVNRASASRLPAGCESELIARVVAGEFEAFHDLIRPYERTVFLVALSLLKNEADAEEVAQEAFLKVFQNLSKFRSEAKFSTWMVQITINEAKAKLRKSRRHLHDSLDELNQNNEGQYIPNEFSDWREIPSEALERRELREALKNGLNSLAHIYRTVLILRDVLQYSVAEAAESLGVSESVVKTRLFRARMQMRDALAPGYDGAWNQSRTYAKARAV